MVRAAWCAACAALLLAPVLAPAAEPPEHRVRGDLAIRARDIFQRYCSECHTGGAEPGRSKLKLMDHKQVVGKPTPVPLASPERAQIIELVKDGSMPPANRPGPTPDEIDVLEKWVRAKAPAYPLEFDERYALAAVADDFERASALTKGGTGENLRYVSFAHLVGDRPPLLSLVAPEQNLRDALSALTGAGADAAVPVDPAATVFRIDTSKLGWSSRALFDKMEARKPDGAVRLRPFDILLLEYPHAVALANDDPQKPRLEKLLARTNQVRPVPFVRGDWLTAALFNGKDLTPLGSEIKSLPLLALALDQQKPEPDGPDAQPFANAKPVVVPAPANGRAPILPLSAWYAGEVAPAKPPFELKAELVASEKVVTQVKVDEPFTLRVSCDQKVYFTLLMVQADGEIVVQRVQGGTVLQPNVERNLSPNGASFVISGITTGKEKATEYFVLFVSETELPPPTILRSKHADKHVWRFLLEPTDKFPFDPNAVVRKVIPITVTRK